MKQKRRLTVYLDEAWYNELSKRARQLKVADDSERAIAAAAPPPPKPLPGRQWQLSPEGKAATADYFTLFAEGKLSLEELNHKNAEAYKAYVAQFRRPVGRPKVPAYAKPLDHYIRQAALAILAGALEGEQHG